MVYVWKFFGITMIYWLAALQTIPPDLYEAAKIDGAGAGADLPAHHRAAAMPFLIIITLLTIEDTFRAFDLMQTMTGGGPFFSTEIIEIYIYRWAFAASIPQLGFASAAAVLFGLFCHRGRALQLWGVYAAPAQADNHERGHGTRRAGPAPALAGRGSPRRLPWWLASRSCWSASLVLGLPVRLDGLGLAEGQPGDLLRGPEADPRDASPGRTTAGPGRDAHFGRYMINTVIVTVSTV